jgi:alpha-tubulin suppressor-like RCC1 family protein
MPRLPSVRVLQSLDPTRLAPIAGLIVLCSLPSACGEPGAPAPVPPAATHLTFTGQPSGGSVGALLVPAVGVEVRDASGQRVSSFAGSVTLTITAGTGTSGATLAGSTAVTAVTGVATFSTLNIDRSGTGYTLSATATGVTGATSAPFDIRLTFATVSAGGGHTCGVTPPGAAYCWGDNQYGQLGDGTTTRRTSPVAVVGGLTFDSLSVGSYHTCGVTRGGEAHCWGAGLWGQLGNGTTINRTSPVAVVGGHAFASVSAGGGHTCGVTSAGRAYCWGYNQSGALGDGDVITRTSPVEVVGGLTFASLSAGGAHTCGVTLAGEAYCWGSNTDGTLGDGTNTDRTMPGTVAGGLIFATVSAGDDRHTCAITTAGGAYCWGANFDGELGDGTMDPQTAPVAVVGGLTFASLSAGGGHTCGVTPADVVYCWGYNVHGQLGDGTTTERQTSPVAVVGGLTFPSLSVGDFHTCGLTRAGAAYCWGYNLDGQLGDGTTIDRTSPMAVAGGITSP